jgi:hypothetical protein
VTVAAKLSGTVSVGGGLSVARFDGSSRQLLFANPRPSFGASQIVDFSPVDLRGTPLIEISTDSPNGKALEGRLGVLWRLNPRAQAGASYRRGPRFGIERNAITFAEPERRVFKVPDVFRAGVAVRPTQALSITSDVSVTDYSDLSKSSDAFDIFDATFPRTVEVHAGMEYIFTNRRFLPALRFGAWREAYSGPVTTNTFNLDLNRERFPSRSAQFHASVGGGLTLFRRMFDVNGAIDVSSLSRVLSVSAIMRFGR